MPMNCKAITGMGTPCQRVVIGSGGSYSGQTLDFENYCGIRCHKEPGLRATQQRQPIVKWGRTIPHSEELSI